VLLLGLEKIYIDNKIEQKNPYPKIGLF